MFAKQHTTTAINLAIYLATPGENIVLANFDYDLEKYKKFENSSLAFARGLKKVSNFRARTRKRNLIYSEEMDEIRSNWSW